MCRFFFKQKTAYEMLRSLVGSEMCIRDRYQVISQGLEGTAMTSFSDLPSEERWGLALYVGPVSYTHLTLPTLAPV